MPDDLPAIQMRQTMSIWADNACVAASQRTFARAPINTENAPVLCRARAFMQITQPLQRDKNYVCNQARRVQVSAPLLTPRACSAGWACNIHSALQSGTIALMMLMIPIGPCEQDDYNFESGMVLSGNRFFAVKRSHRHSHSVHSARLLAQ